MNITPAKNIITCSNISKCLQTDQNRKQLLNIKIILGFCYIYILYIHKNIMPKFVHRINKSIK